MFFASGSAERNRRAQAAMQEPIARGATVGFAHAIARAERQAARSGKAPDLTTLHANFRPIVENTWRASVVAVRREWRRMEGKSADDQTANAALARLRDEGGARITAISETTRKRIVEALAATIHLGETARAAAVLEILGGRNTIARAAMIARTEVHTAAMTAAHDSAVESGFRWHFWAAVRGPANPTRTRPRQRATPANH